MSHDLTRYQGLLKNIDQLPPHITFVQYNELRQQTNLHWSSKHGDKSRFFQDRDLLLIDLLWATGGRINDICSMQVTSIDFQERQLNLYTRKRRKTIAVILDDATLLDVSEFLRKYEPNGRLFRLTRQHAWRIVKRYGRLAGIPHIHPHMFRHGLAVHLLNEGVPVPVISARLGHSNVYVTMQMYMKVTPEIQRRHIQAVRFRL